MDHLPWQRRPRRPPPPLPSLRAVALRTCAVAPVSQRGGGLRSRNMTRACLLCHPATGLDDSAVGASYEHRFRVGPPVQAERSRRCALRILASSSPSAAAAAIPRNRNQQARILPSRPRGSATRRACRRHLLRQPAHWATTQPRSPCQGVEAVRQSPLSLVPLQNAHNAVLEANRSSARIALQLRAAPFCTGCATESGAEHTR